MGTVQRRCFALPDDMAREYNMKQSISNGRAPFYAGGPHQSYRTAGALPKFSKSSSEVTDFGYSRPLHQHQDKIDMLAHDASNGTRYAERTDGHGGDYYNHRPTLTGLTADDYHGNDSRNAGFVVTAGAVGGYLPARKESNSALQETEALLHRYRRNHHKFTSLPEENKMLGSSPTLPINPGASLRHSAGYEVQGTPLAGHQSSHYSAYGGLAPGQSYHRGNIAASPRLQLEMRLHQDDCRGGQWDERAPSRPEQRERASRVMARYAQRTGGAGVDRFSTDMPASEYPLAP